MSCKDTLTRALVFASIINLAFIGWRLLPVLSSRYAPSALSHTYQGHDFPDLLPEVEVGSVEFVVEESADYPVLGLASDAQWFSLAGPHEGFVRLGQDDRIFVVSMFHELHCLRLLNAAFDGPASTVSKGHAQHCLNYLRQMALCSADLTLEPGDFATRNFTESERGATHTCRDWRTVYIAMQENWESWRGRSQ